MTHVEQTTRQLIEMFPKLTEKQAKNLAESGDDINILITRVLDDNVENPVHEIKEMFYRGKTKYIAVPNLNYPEVFKRNSNIDTSLDIRDLRKKASLLNEEAAHLGKLAFAHEIKPSRSHYSLEADEKRQKAKELNEKAALVLMRKAVESSGQIDFHGLTVKEALKFLDDLYKFKKFERIEIITGQIYKSSRIRPAVREWLESHGFTSSDLGASILGIKRTFH